MNTHSHSGWTREEMARRVAVDIPDGAYVNLGIGIPELVAQFTLEKCEVIFQTENGLLGMGPAPAPGAEDPELINAGKKAVTAIPGAAYFHHADSFTMIRGGHIDICVLGAMQVSAEGDLANWSTGETDAIPAVGGAMDLVAGVKQIFIVTEHTTKSGEPKIVSACTYPLTGQGVVDRIYTNLAVIDIAAEGLVLRELAPGVSWEEVQSKTGAPIIDRRQTPKPNPTTPHPSLSSPSEGEERVAAGRVRRGCPDAVHGEGWGEGQPIKTRETSPHPDSQNRDQLHRSQCSPPSFRRSGEGEETHASTTQGASRPNDSVV